MVSRVIAHRYLVIATCILWLVVPSIVKANNSRWTLWCLESLLPLFYPISLTSARRVSAFECSCDSIGPTRLIPDTICSLFLELAIVEVGIFIKGISVALTLSSFETRTCALMKKAEIYFFSCKFSWLPTVSFSVLFDLLSITQKKTSELFGELLFEKRFLGVL